MVTREIEKGLENKGDVLFRIKLTQETIVVSFISFIIVRTF